MNHTTNDATSLQRLYGGKKPLTKHAADLLKDMKSELPSDGIEEGVLYQLKGKTLKGVDCSSLLVIPNSEAVFVDLYTGIVASVDENGVRKTRQIGGRR